MKYSYENTAIDAMRCETVEEFLEIQSEDPKEWRRQIYAAVYRSVKDIAKEAGMPQSRLAEYFCIPRRTMEDWCRGVAKCPVYTRMMMQEVLGLVKREP